MKTESVLPSVFVLFAVSVSCGGRTPLDNPDEVAGYGKGGTSAASVGGNEAAGHSGTSVIGTAGGGAVQGHGGAAGAAGHSTAGHGGGSGGMAGHPGGGGAAGAGASSGAGGASGSAAGASNAANGGSAGLGVGGNQTGGSAGGAGHVCPPVMAPGGELIDDMNDGNRFIPSVNGRAGSWADSHDNTEGVTMFPDPADPFVMSDTGDDCHGYAVHVYGGPYVDWGATVRLGLGSPYDASAYTGITFWAKADQGKGMTLRVSFPDIDTDPEGMRCVASPGAQQCYDHFKMRVRVPETWTAFTVPFSSLRQDSWGYLADAFDPSTLYQILFEIPETEFGLWIDAVAFTTTP
jgi:hypothetical protein